MLIAILQLQPYAIFLSGDATTRIGALQLFRGQFFEHIFCNENTVLDPQAYGRRPADVPPTFTRSYCAAYQADHSRIFF